MRIIFGTDEILSICSCQRTLTRLTDAGTESSLVLKNRATHRCSRYPHTRNCPYFRRKLAVNSRLSESEQRGLLTWTHHTSITIGTMGWTWTGSRFSIDVISWTSYRLFVVFHRRTRRSERTECYRGSKVTLLNCYGRYCYFLVVLSRLAYDR